MAAWWHRGSQMPTVEERLAYLEGRGQYQGISITDLRTSIGEVRADIRDLRGEISDLRGDMGGLRGEMRDLRGEVRADIRDLRSEMGDLRGEMNRRFEGVDTKFTWVIGIQVTMLLMMAGSLFGLYFR
jgi:uncharacterized coiled-coil protein SlyX